MTKIIALNYTFDASAKQVTFTDYNPIIIERVLVITNVTDNVIIYNFADPAKGGTAATNVLTLDYDTSTMSDTDKLQIFYDDVATTQPVSGTVAVTNADLATVAGAVSATHMQSDIVGALPAGAAKIGDTGMIGNSAADGTGTDYHLIVDAAGHQQVDVLTLPANASANIAQMNGVTVLMGSGNTGTGSQRVTLATDQVAVASKAAINTYVDGSIVTIGAKADAKSTATDTTAVTLMQVMKQISASVQAPPSQAVTNAGTFATQENGSALTSLQLLDDTVFADDSAFTIATSKVTSIGLLADETSTDSVDEGDIGLPRMTLDRKQIVVLSPHATGESLDTFFSIDLDETEEDIKATSGKIYGYYIYNSTAATLYVRFYNATAANTTVGTTAAILVIPVPAGAAANCSFPQGIGFSTALCAAATTGVAANDTGAPAANALVINVFYK